MPAMQIKVTQEEFDALPVVESRQECLANKTTLTKFNFRGDLWYCHVHGVITRLVITTKNAEKNKAKRQRRKLRMHK